MTDALYTDAHAAISRLIRRTYNNPLGEQVFPLLDRLLKPRSTPSILDAGCGRGHAALWWARHDPQAHVVGFDPAPAMLAEGRAAAADYADRLHFVQASFDSFASSSDFDLILAHDVLCYSPAWEADFQRLTTHLAPGGILSVSDYFMEPDAQTALVILDAWHIQKPAPFAERASFLQNLPGFRPLLHLDTTSVYAAHWRDMRTRVLARRTELVTAVGEVEVESYLARIDAILAAVAEGRYGHHWALLTRVL